MEYGLKPEAWPEHSDDLKSVIFGQSVLSFYKDSSVITTSGSDIDKINKIVASHPLNQTKEAFSKDICKKLWRDLVPSKSDTVLIADVKLELLQQVKLYIERAAQALRSYQPQQQHNHNEDTSSDAALNIKPDSPPLETALDAKEEEESSKDSTTPAVVNKEMPSSPKKQKRSRSRSVIGDEVGTRKKQKGIEEFKPEESKPEEPIDNDEEESSNKTEVQTAAPADSEEQENVHEKENFRDNEVDTEEEPNSESLEAKGTDESNDKFPNSKSVTKNTDEQTAKKENSSNEVPQVEEEDVNESLQPASTASTQEPGSHDTKPSRRKPRTLRSSRATPDADQTPSTKSRDAEVEDNSQKRGKRATEKAKTPEEKTESIEPDQLIEHQGKSSGKQKESVDKVAKKPTTENEVSSDGETEDTKAPKTSSDSATTKRKRAASSGLKDESPLELLMSELAKDSNLEKFKETKQHLSSNIVSPTSLTNIASSVQEKQLRNIDVVEIELFKMLANSVMSGEADSTSIQPAIEAVDSAVLQFREQQNGRSPSPSPSYNKGSSTAPSSKRRRRD